VQLLIGDGRAFVSEGQDAAGNELCEILMDFVPEEWVGLVAVIFAHGPVDETSW
jgi:hypothetical protein